MNINQDNRININSMKDFTKRIWNLDFTLWSQKPAEISNRLGWLEFDNNEKEELKLINDNVKKIISEGFNTVVLIGMGGSSLAPLMFSKIFKRKDGYLELIILDTTDPDYLLEIKDKLDLEKTIFVVSSKSGGTMEVITIFEYFHSLVLDKVGIKKAGNSFVAITDAGSGLEKIAIEGGFRLILKNDPNMGGRYSALSYFGLFPAGLMGIDIKELMARAKIEKVKSKDQEFRNHLDFLQLARYKTKFKNEIDINFPVSIGAYIGNEALAGKDKLTFILSNEIKSFGQWLEQLIAESTGKDGKGILPISTESLGKIQVYGRDRLFVKIIIEGDSSLDNLVDKLKKAGFPVIEIEMKDKYEIGGQIFMWEMATATMGYVLGVNPFDQPNVERSKILTAKMLQDQLANDTKIIHSKDDRIEEENTEILNIKLKEIIDNIHSFKEGDYFSIHGFFKESDAATDLLKDLSNKIRELTKCPVTFGYGPRLLHSTGQIHKGDKGNGIFIQLTSINVKDIIISDKLDKDKNLINNFGIKSEMSFSKLIKAQAKGDEMALLEAGRRIISINMGQNIEVGLQTIIDSLNN